MARPRTPLLDRERIVGAAAELVDRHGDFTVGELAKALRVHPSSLYHHVSGRDEVVDLIRSRVGDEIDISGFGHERWDAAIERLARSYRLAFARRPGAIRLLATSPIRDASSLAAYDTIAKALLEAGFAAHIVFPIIQALDNYLLGSALDLAAEDVMYVLDPDAHPSLCLAAEAAGGDGTRADHAFETGLRALVEGFRRLHAEPGDPPDRGVGTAAG
jgi:AcrR family transcriptional regulator